MTALALLDDVIDGVPADIADGTETESHDIADRRIFEYRLIHVRRQHLNAHAPRLAEIQCGLVLIGAGALQ